MVLIVNLPRGQANTIMMKALFQGYISVICDFQLCGILSKISA